MELCTRFKAGCKQCKSLANSETMRAFRFDPDPVVLRVFKSTVSAEQSLHIL